MDKIKELELKLANAKKEEKAKKIKVWQEGAKKYLGKCILKGNKEDFSLYILNTKFHPDFGSISIQTHTICPGSPFGYTSDRNLSFSNYLPIEDQIAVWGKEITKEKCDEILEYIRNSRTEYFKGLNKITNG